MFYALFQNVKLTLSQILCNIFEGRHLFGSESIINQIKRIDENIPQ
jgi:hypothetical protein